MLKTSSECHSSEKECIAMDQWPMKRSIKKIVTSMICNLTIDVITQIFLTDFTSREQGKNREHMTRNKGQLRCPKALAKKRVGVKTELERTLLCDQMLKRVMAMQVSPVANLGTMDLVLNRKNEITNC